MARPTALIQSSFSRSLSAIKYSVTFEVLTSNACGLFSVCPTPPTCESQRFHTRARGRINTVPFGEGVYPSSPSPCGCASGGTGQATRGERSGCVCVRERVNVEAASTHLLRPLHGQALVQLHDAARHRPLRERTPRPPYARTCELSPPPRG